MGFWTDMRDWWRGCPLWRLRGQLRGRRVDTVTEGNVRYGISMAFVEGTTLQDLMAAAAATTAIWMARCSDAIGDFDVVEVEHGTYQVETDIHVRFHPIKPGDAVPVFDGQALVKMLERSQR